MRPSPRPPAAAWLRWGGPDGQLLAALRADAPGAAEQVAHALLDNPTLLGDQTGTPRGRGVLGPPSATPR
ncbi:hypothetical protein ACQPXS_01785 [Streptomyces sp. CA-142005]|uniref:hypothetical protein n=1 Tax=Streptomyces sp. CA-142005 TaxID=3240052 RepID=UPI003D923338